MVLHGPPVLKTGDLRGCSDLWPMGLAACSENGGSGKVPADSGRKMEIKGKCGSRIALHKRGAVHKPENGLMGQPLPFGFPMRADSGARCGKAPFCLPFSFPM
ncbi:MAG: hypothetical protein CW346_08975 [Bacillaceae bacterium]|nr:hypothetical protein [Bacillaceae bacterium]